MGNLFKEDELRDYIRPSKLGNSDLDICLGVKIDRRPESGWGLWFVLYWLDAEPNLSISIWLKDTEAADNILRAFKKRSKETVGVWSAGHEVYVSRAIAPDHEEQFPETMRELTGSFSDLWKNADDLQAAVKPPNSKNSESDSLTPTCNQPGCRFLCRLVRTYTGRTSSAEAKQGAKGR
jgi:hypothetical protein